MKVSSEFSNRHGAILLKLTFLYLSQKVKLPENIACALNDTVKVPYFASLPNFVTFGLFVARVHWYAMEISCQLSKR